MQVPKLIRPPTDATSAEAAAAPGRSRALPDDFLREASARLGITSLVAVTLEHLVLACLAKKPEDRPRNAQQLAQSLATIDGMTWGEEEAHRWWRQDHPPQAPTCDAIAL